MKLTMLLTLLSAALASASIALLPIAEDAHAGDIVLSETELDDLEAAHPLETRSSYDSIMRPRSTTCAAHPRSAIRRSLEGITEDIEGPTTKALGIRSNKKCMITAHVANPGKRTFILGISQQRCANACICEKASKPCKAFSWNDNGRGTSRGRCVLYSKSFQQMRLVPGPGDDQHPTRVFWSRTCYHKGPAFVPSPVNTDSYPLPTPPAYGKRQLQVEAGLMAALAGRE